MNNMINSFFSINVYPSAAKLAKVIPIPKLKNPITCADFRPISLQKTLSKVIEKFMLVQIKHYIEENSAFGMGQYNDVIPPLKHQIQVQPQCRRFPLIIFSC